jgi:hypothetical protein
MPTAELAGPDALVRALELRNRLILVHLKLPGFAWLRKDTLPYVVSLESLITARFG